MENMLHGIGFCDQVLLIFSTVCAFPVVKNLNVKTNLYETNSVYQETRFLCSCLASGR